MELPAKVETPEIVITEAPPIKPQEKGWTQAVPYNYEVLGAGTQKEVEKQEAAGHQIPDWASNARVYEYDGEHGEIGPEDEQLEYDLFKAPWVPVQGEFLRNLIQINVVQEGPIQIQPIRKFEDAGLHPAMLQNIVKCSYTTPTPVQAYAIPAIKLGYDLIAVAQTGCGKTAAYLAPVLSKLMGKAKLLAAPRRVMAKDKLFDPAKDSVAAEPLVLIICPGRELAIQVFDETRRFCYRTMLRPCAIYGGGPRRDQILELSKGCDILIATPGRLRDLMAHPKILKLNRLKFTIIDEADEMLKPDWEDDLKQILLSDASTLDGDHQFMMFSATFPKDSRVIARQYLTADHVRIHVGRIGSTHQNVFQQIIWVEEDLKQKALYDLLISTPPCRTIVFVNTVHKCDQVDDYMFNLDFPCTSLHSKRTQREREDAIHAFRTGKTPILIATNCAARGLNVKNVMHIVNYDMPSSGHGGINEYVHRIGRTGRIGNKGMATSFFNKRDEVLAVDLVKVLMETNTAVPDFLEEFAPTDGVIEWNDDTDEEVEEDADDEIVRSDSGEDPWGAGGTTAWVEADTNNGDDDPRGGVPLPFLQKKSLPATHVPSSMPVNW